MFLCVALQMLIGIFVGYQLQKNFRGRDLVFTLLMMPMMLSPVVVGFLWRYMFNSEWGVINFLLTTVGLDKIDWLGQTNAALWAAVIADTWMWTPFIILLATAAFRGIPETIYEAAEVDGASPAYRFFRITLPMSAPVLFIALILRLIDSFKQYDLFLALTGGGPGSSTDDRLLRGGQDRVQLLLHRRGLGAGRDPAGHHHRPVDDPGAPSRQDGREILMAEIVARRT